MAMLSDTSDPTAQLLRDLDDPTKYRAVRNAPIFRPHSRTRPIRNPDGSVGTQSIDVNLGDLDRIAARIEQRIAESNTLTRVTIGHVRPDLPETAQPPIVGWAKNPRVGRFGDDIPCVMADLYIKVEHWEEAKKYPFRSVEYYAERDEVTGVALLVRDPYLDLGVLAYSRDPIFYQLEPNDMADAPPKDDKKPDAPPDAAATTSPDDEPLTMAKLNAHPAWQYMCQQYAASQAGGAPGAAAAPPGPAQMPAPGQAAKFQRDVDAIRYAKIEADIESLRAENKRLDYERRLINAEARVKQLVYEGYMIPDPDAEAKRIAGLDTAAAEARETEIRTCYQRAPIGGLIRIDDRPVEGLPRAAKQADIMDEAWGLRAVEYMREHPGISPAEAKEKTRLKTAG